MLISFYQQDKNSQPYSKLIKFQFNNIKDQIKKKIKGKIHYENAASAFIVHILPNFKVLFQQNYPDDIWNQYYSNNNVYKPITENTSIINEYGNYFLHDVLLSYFKTRIIDLRDNQKALIYKTIFDSNSNKASVELTGNLINKIGGNLIQVKVSSYNTAISGDTFTAIHSNVVTSSNDLSPSYIIESTFTNSVACGTTIRSQYGKIIFNNINVSNIVSSQRYSGYSVFSKIQANISFSTFSNITSKYGLFAHEDFMGTIHQLNIINNNCKINVYYINPIFLLNDICSISVRDCVITYNSAEYLSYAYSSSVIYFIHCWISSTNSFTQTYYGSYSISDSISYLSLNLPNVKIIQSEDFNKKYVYIHSLQVENSPLIKSIDTELNITVHFDLGLVIKNTTIKYWFDDNSTKFIMDNVSFQQNNGIHQSMINIPDWLTTETHKISMKIISNDEIESNIINSTIAYRDPVDISISGMFYNSQNVAFMGNISLKQNVNAKRFNASFRNFADSSKSILLNDRINGYQYFDVILQFPSNLEYGIHIIDILAVNENDRVIGKKSIEFNYIKQTKYSHCMNIQSHIRKR